MESERQSSPRNRTCVRVLVKTYGEVATNSLFEPSSLLALGDQLSGDEGLKTFLRLPVAVAHQLVQDGGLAAEPLQIVAVEVEDGLLLEQVETLENVRVLHRFSAGMSLVTNQIKPTAHTLR